jgi:hypothetical protein
MEIQEEKLKQASEEFHQACDSRLAEKEALAYTGWDDNKNYEDILNQLLIDVIDAGLIPSDKDPSKKLLDISNRAMMLWKMTKKKNEPK